MIFGIGGKLSGGKTCTAVMYSYDKFLAGKKIIANFKINFPEYPNCPDQIFISNTQFVDFIKKNYHNQDALKKLFFNSVLILDEIGQIISSRRSSTGINQLITGFLMMAGKIDLDVVYTAQVQDSMVDKILRECTNVYCNCFRIREDGSPLIFEDRIYQGKIRIAILLQLDFDIGGQVIKTLVYDPEMYYSFYDTREITLLDSSQYMRGGSKDLRKI